MCPCAWVWPGRSGGLGWWACEGIRAFALALLEVVLETAASVRHVPGDVLCWRGYEGSLASASCLGVLHRRRRYPRRRRSAVCSEAVRACGDWFRSAGGDGFGLLRPGRRLPGG